MASSVQIQRCSSCNGSLAGLSMFTAECSHSFHFRCILTHHNRSCPICNATWNHFPPQLNSINPINNPFLQNPVNNPFTQNPVNNPFTQNPVNNLFRQRQFYPNPPSPMFGFYEPPQFCDDEPLVVDPTSHVTSTEVAIKAFPERPAVAASESVSLFTVLVGLKAPPLSEDAQRASIDMVTVLDVSGSMFGQKLDLVKKAVHFVIDNLGVSDRLSIVAFSDEGMRVLPLLRMTENGREDAHKAVDKLVTMGGTNIVKGLMKGVKVLEERRHRNPVSSIIFLSDGQDTYNNFNQFQNDSTRLNLSHAIPVHSFGFGSDHDPVTMHAISDASGGTFSYIGSIEMIQDAFAGCIGGLLSVVSQEVRLNLRSASHGVEIKSISSGRYSAEIMNKGSEGIIKIGDLYADEEKDFLINLSVPKNEGEGNTSLLDITCSYKDAVSKSIVQVEGDLVEIQRPEMVSPQDVVINMEVDRQRNRVYAAESIKEAQQMAEKGNFESAKNLLAKTREDVLGSASAQGGDGLCLWLADEMKETERLMGSSQIYQQSGRAFALAGMSSHAAQRATSRAGSVLGAPMGMATGAAFGAPAAGAAFGAPAAGAAFGAPAAGYVTPNMAFMVNKSQQLNKKEDIGPKSFLP